MSKPVPPKLLSLLSLRAPLQSIGILELLIGLKKLTEIGKIREDLQEVLKDSVSH